MYTSIQLDALDPIFFSWEAIIISYLVFLGLVLTGFITDPLWVSFAKRRERERERKVGVKIESTCAWGSTKREVGTFKRKKKDVVGATKEVIDR